MTQSYTKSAVRSGWGDTADAANLQDPGDAFANTSWLQSTTLRAVMNASTVIHNR